MRITIISRNIHYGARRNADFVPQNRWPGLVRSFKHRRAQILLLQECDGWEAAPELAEQAEQDLGMRALVAPSPTGRNTAVMFDERVLELLEWETKYSWRAHHGFGVAVLRVPGLALPLTVIPVHLIAESAEAAAIEAQFIASRAYRYQGVAVIGGDRNHVPLGDPEPDWRAVQPYNRSSRAIRLEDGTYIGNRIVAEKLRNADLTDVADYLSTVLRRPELRAPTSLGGLRVDGFDVTPALLPAVVDYWNHPDPYSDHNEIGLVIDTNLIDTSQPLSWK